MSVFGSAEEPFMLVSGYCLPLFVLFTYVDLPVVTRTRFSISYRSLGVVFRPHASLRPSFKVRLPCRTRSGIPSSFAPYTLPNLSPSLFPPKYHDLSDVLSWWVRPDTPGAPQSEIDLSCVSGNVPTVDQSLSPTEEVPVNLR